jgi:hypothetical protein
MPDVDQADTPLIRDAPPTSPTIPAEDVRTMILKRNLPGRTVPQAPGSATSSCGEGLEFHGIAKIGQAFK